MKKNAVSREHYLRQIRPMYDDEQIKIIMGMRRCGKSVLLKQIIDEINEYTQMDHVIYINLESLQFVDMLDVRILNVYIEKLIVDNLKYYIFIDEIQMVPDFELLLNSLRSTQNVSLFVTGSNGKLLSSELSTMLSGRYVKYEISPFSFREAAQYCEVQKIDYDGFFDNYIRWGGLPHRFDIHDLDSLSGYLSDVYESISSRDVVQRAHIRNVQLFNDVFRYALETSGSLFSLKSVVNYLISSGRKASGDSIYEYLDAACAALLLHRVERYNIAGKNILSSMAKYYATDLGIMQIKAAKNKINEGALLENIVYNELRNRGYEVYVGHLSSAEIDFVAIRNGVTEYYQVTTHLEGNEELSRREFKAFELIKDNYLKYIISKDKIDHSRDGIIHQNIVDWISE
jgi:predicted AAA+ superfamily ATPase